MRLPKVSTVHLADQRKRRESRARTAGGMRTKLELIIKHKWLYILFLTPAVVTTVLFRYRPMVGVIMAFQKFDISAGSYLTSPFVGFANFEQFLTNPRFYQALNNTLGLSLLSLFVVFPLPIIFALLLNELQNVKAKRVVQTITYLPHFISWVVVATMVYRLVDPSTGIVGRILEVFGREAIPFMREPRYFWTITIVSSIWKELGWSAIIYIAAISSIDPQLFEAAFMDGANRLQMVWHITLPSIVETVALMLILNVSALVSSGGLFDAVFNLSNPMVNEKSYTLEMYSYYEGIMAGKYSYATAITLTQAVVGLLLVISANQVYKRATGKSVF